MNSRRVVRRTLLLTCAVLAFAAMPALARAETVTLKGGGVTLAPGTAVEGDSSNLRFATPGEVYQCSVNHVEGEVTENPGATLEILAGEFSGSDGGDCRSNSPGLTATITPENLPWRMQFDKIGSLGTSAIANFTWHFVQGAITCEYGATAAGSFTVGSQLGDVISGQVLTLTNSGAGCWSEGILSGTMTFTSGGNSVTAN